MSDDNDNERERTGIRQLLNFLGWDVGGHLDVYLANAERAFLSGCSDVADSIRDLAEAVREHGRRER